MLSGSFDQSRAPTRRQESIFALVARDSVRSRHLCARPIIWARASVFPVKEHGDPHVLGDRGRLAALRVGGRVETTPVDERGGRQVHLGDQLRDAGMAPPTSAEGPKLRGVLARGVGLLFHTGVQDQFRARLFELGL